MKNWLNVNSKVAIGVVCMMLIASTLIAEQVTGTKRVLFQVPDKGVFSDLDGEIAFGILENIDKKSTSILVDKKNETLSVFFDDVSIKSYPILSSSVPARGEKYFVPPNGLCRDSLAGCIGLRAEDAQEVHRFVRVGVQVLVRKKLPKRKDLDMDGIPNQTDVLVGALKTAINGASYDASYKWLPYPGGDVPRKTGCCADVAIRSLRNAGLDLQKEMYKDIVARPSAYRGIDNPNRNIDHRRVRNMVIYMKKYFRTVDHKDGAKPKESWLPGDIVLFNTFGQPGPDHIGIVSSSIGESGYPLVINNWAPGAVTAEMDLLEWCPVTHHFRIRG